MAEEKKVKEENTKVSAKLQKLVDEVATLSVLEVAELVKALEDKFGVSATPVAVAGAAPAADADAVPTTSTIKIALDIKPKCYPNKLYVKKKWKKKWKKKCKKGIVKAAILGTETFNVRDIEIDTISLNGVAPRKYGYKDLTCPTVLNPCDCEALDPDTFEDLVLYFEKKDIVGTLGDVHNGDEIPLTIIGKLTDGVTEIEGPDCIQEGKKK